jgi:hypothetical protein
MSFEARYYERLHAGVGALIDWICPHDGQHQVVNGKCESIVPVPGQCPPGTVGTVINGRFVCAPVTVPQPSAPIARGGRLPRARY